MYEPPAIIAPDQNSAIKGAKKAANEAKLVGAIEISTVREAHPLGPGPYILCIRGTNAVTGTRPYAVFFKSNEFVAIRSPVIMDDCERQVFGPLGIGPFPDEPRSRWSTRIGWLPPICLLIVLGAFSISPMG